jgi:hypothetical protein
MSHVSMRAAVVEVVVSSKPKRLPQDQTATGKVDSIPLRDTGASVRARAAHGVMPNPTSVPSGRGGAGAPDLGRLAKQKLFSCAEYSSCGTKSPGDGKGVNSRARVWALRGD